MQLDQFITNTLTDVVNGVRKANETFKETSKFELRTGEEIAFDIAITVSEESSSKKGGGISVYSIKLGGEKGSSDSNQNITRIKFKIKPNYNMK